MKTMEKLFLRHGSKGWILDAMARGTGMAKNAPYKIIRRKELLIGKIAITRMRSDVDAFGEFFSKEPGFLKAAGRAARHLSRSISMDKPLVLPAYFHKKGCNIAPGAEFKVI